MISKNTVFVIGAGSGVEVDMPLGSQLLTEISKVLQCRQTSPGAYRFDDEIIRKTLSHITFRESGHQWPGQMYHFAVAAKTIRDGLIHSDSIDDLLHIHRSDSAAVRLGKLAISRVILDKERNCKLVKRNGTSQLGEFNPYQNCWYNKIFKIITRGAQIENLDDIFENITFVNFNYDRLLEFYLVHALHSLFKLDLSKCIELIGKVKIIHPYGSLGQPFEFSVDEIALNVGMPLNEGIDLERVSERIKIYTEQVNDENLQQDIESAMAAAEQVIFLGFGFHKQNIKILELETRADSGRYIYATAIGISEPNRMQISKELRCIGGLSIPGSTKRDRVYLHPELGCMQLLTDYERVISA